MGSVRVEHDGAIGIVTLSNPGKLNAIDVGMWKALTREFNALSQDDAIRCIIVHGEGGHFAAGADIEEFATVRNTVAQGIEYHDKTIASALTAVTDCRHPTIAAIEGTCVGGGLEIACACDIRIAAPSARFGIPINRLGFPLAPREMQFMLQLIGKATTLEILLEGRVFDAAEAKDKRLINRIADDAVVEARDTAERIACSSPLAAQANKQLARRLSSVPELLTEHELREAFALLDSQDYREGVQAFLDKRDPIFTGK